MDDAVLRAMARWPNVPAVFGWLRLDARGEWWVKDAASDVFERISNSKIIEFVGRNYAGDADGRWFFQNGPQRVYVELANPVAAPYVLRLNDACDGLLTHNDLVALPTACAFDDAGHCVLDTDRGIGVLIDRDLAVFVDALTYARVDEPHELGASTAR